MAHKKAGGSTKNGRDSHSKRLGVKRFGGEHVLAGQHHHPPARHPGARRRERRHRAPTTPCLPRSPARCSSSKKGAEQRMYVSVVPEKS